ncbi:MAG: hypothetical protein R3E97_14165 [Candidatus Eisenbacteria bacterium]
MSFHYRILKSPPLILECFHGVIDLPSLESAFQRIRTDPSYDPQADGLAMLIGATVDLRVEQVKELVEGVLSRPNASRGRWALLVTEPIATALSCYLGKLVSERQTFEVFCTLEAAVKWLGVDPSPRELDCVNWPE